MKDDANAFAAVFRVPGASEGPLAGTTFAAKDLFDVAGHVTGCGNPEWSRTHEAATEHAWAVRALLEAGSTLAGKAHTDELAYSLMGVNAHYGTPLNTADPRRVPGGSSSGSASAVAAGLVDIGLGSDTGGSVRIPASFCGLWGIRTTFGLVPLTGVMPFTTSFDTVGWFAGTGALMDRAAAAMGCPEGAAPTRLLLPVDVWAQADADCVAALAPGLAKLQAAMGPAAPLILAPDGLATWRETFRICQAGEIWASLGGWISTHEPDFGPGIRERFEMARSIDAPALAEARSSMAAISARMQDVVSPDTVLVLPTAPGPAPLRVADAAFLDAYRRRALEMLCPAGLAGLPQLSVPMGTVDGGPVGLSLVGARRQDRALIALAESAGLARQEKMT